MWHMQAQQSDARAQRMVVHELAAERASELEAGLAQQRRSLEALQAASRELAAQNGALQKEAAGLREAKRLLEFRTATLQVLHPALPTHF